MDQEICSRLAKTLENLLDEATIAEVWVHSRVLPISPDDERRFDTFKAKLAQAIREGEKAIGDWKQATK